MGFTIFRGCMTALICLALLALFFFPSQHLSRFADGAGALIADAASALQNGDPDAIVLFEILSETVQEEMPVLERFLNHADIDALDGAAARALTAARAGDTGTALDALTEADTILRRILGIELFSWNSLL